MPKYKTTRLAIIRRMIAIPLLLQQKDHSQSQLKQILDVDGITIRRDILALSEFWPIKRIKEGRFVFYRLAPDAKPKLKMVR